MSSLFGEMISVTGVALIYSHTFIDVATYSTNQRFGFIFTVRLLAVTELHMSYLLGICGIG